MFATVQFTIHIENMPHPKHDSAAGLTSASHVAGITPPHARLFMHIGDTQIDLGVRPLDMTLEALLAETPLLVPDAAEDIFGQWLWGRNTKAAALYRQAIEDAGDDPPRVTWQVRGADVLDFPDLPVEALLGDGVNPPAVSRQVAKSTQHLSTSVGKYLPPIGQWRIAPVSLLSRNVLMQTRDPSQEYDAITRKRLPTLEVLDIEYAVTRARLTALLSRLGAAHVQVLHLIAGRRINAAGLLLEDAFLTASGLAEMLSEGDWNELQLIVVSVAQTGTGGNCSFPWAIMELIPLQAAICFQDNAAVNTCILPFCELFYGALGAGYAIDAAVSRARTAMRDSGEFGAADVLSPVLYLREGEEAPAIRSGDRGLEGLLVATEAITTARDVFDDPEVLQLDGQVPVALSQIHARLTNVIEQQMAHLRDRRAQHLRALRHEVHRAAPTYTASSAVAQQLNSVLDMAPAPAEGGSGRPPLGPPAFHWWWLLRHIYRDEAKVTASPFLGPRKLYYSDSIRTWAAIQHHDRSSPIHVGFSSQPGDIHFAPLNGPRAIFDISRWPPPLISVEDADEDETAYYARLEHDLASGAAQAIRRLLRLHFRNVLAEQSPPLYFPGGISPGDLLRGGLAGLGIKTHDVEPITHNDVPWSRGVHLLADLDSATRILAILRQTPTGQLSEDHCRILRDFQQSISDSGQGIALVCLDVWPVSGTLFWQPACAIAAATRPSWVWEQLPQTIDEYRSLLLQRLWEWWIGALRVEN
jgi:hypothetical protein